MGYASGQRHDDNLVDVVDLLHVAVMDESYGTYVDDKYFNNHDYDDTDDDTVDDSAAPGCWSVEHA